MGRSPKEALAEYVNCLCDDEAIKRLESLRRAGINADTDVELVLAILAEQEAIRIIRKVRYGWTKNGE